MSQSDVQDAVQAIQAWLDDPPGEAVVRQCIVLRLLMAAGFDIWNPEEVHPEETNVTGNRADFLIRRGAGKFALELKGMNASLQAREYQQAVNYAISVGTRWAIVTNGRLWRVLDERLDGDWNAKVALTVEMAKDDETFAEDIVTLLDPRIWEQDAFADAVQTVVKRQQQRKDEARIRREKTRVVEETQKEFEIATFEKAAEAATKMGRITEVEKDVLLGIETHQVYSKDAIISASGDEDISYDYRSRLPSSLGFTYKIKGAVAFVRWDTSRDVWTVRKGSTALDRLSDKYNVDDYAMILLNSLIGRGLVKRRGDGMLEYVDDVEYTSASQAAMYIAGRSVNGWEAWKDGSGRAAKVYRDT